MGEGGNFFWKGGGECEFTVFFGAGGMIRRTRMVAILYKLSSLRMSQSQGWPPSLGLSPFLTMVTITSITLNTGVKDGYSP